MTRPLLTPLSYSHEPDDAPPSDYLFWCPGCEKNHAFRVRERPDFDPTRHRPSPVWTFNGDLEHPTFSPSLRVLGGPNHTTSCHLFLRDGQLQFCSDSPHHLAGKTVPLEPEPPLDS